MVSSKLLTPSHPRLYTGIYRVKELATFHLNRSVCFYRVTGQKMAHRENTVLLRSLSVSHSRACADRAAPGPEQSGAGRDMG